MLVPSDVDVLVVGGGPAGLVAGAVAAKAGLRTTILEREQTIGSPVHTSGGVALSTIQEFGIPEELYHPVTAIRFCSPRESALFQAEEPFGCIIDVQGTYQHLAARAEKFGAQVLTGTQAVGPLVRGSHVVGCEVRSTQGTRSVSSRILIDAGGYRADMSKAADLHEGFKRFGVGAELEILASKCPQEEIVLVVGNRYAPSGYGWVFPWGKGRVRVGVGLLHADTREDPRRLARLFLEEIDRFGVQLGDYDIIEDHFGLIPASGLADRIAGNGIMAVGDAAGVATLVVGEGIRLSMESGRLAGQTAVRALAAGRTDAAMLRRYEKEFRRRYGLDLTVSRIINKRMASWSDEKWDDRVRTLRDVPTPLLMKILQSHFSARDVMSWLITRPHLWRKVTRWIAKGMMDFVRAR